jgi:hypothetical protein
VTPSEVAGTPLTGQVTYTPGNVTILDANSATVQFVDTSPSIGEESSTPLSVRVQLVIAGSDSLEDQAEFNVIVASLGAGMTAADFNSGSFPHTVIFPATSGDGTMATAVFDPTGDAVSEGDESLTLGLAKKSGASTIAVTGTGHSTETVTIVDDDVDLVVTSKASTNSVVAGSGPGNLTHTFTVTNGRTAVTGVSLSELITLPAGVTIVSITPSGAGTYVPPNAANGKWTVPSLLPGKSENLVVVFTVGAGAAAGTSVISTTTVLAINENRVNVGDDTATQQTLIAANVLDFGDAPNSYGTLLASNGARHHISPLFLGTGVDPELNGQPNTTATADDSAAIDDEDGVTLPGYLVPGLEASIGVVASAAGKLDAWIDFKRNGVFDAVDRVFASFAVVPGANKLKFAVPTTAVAGTTFVRFRLSSAGGLGPNGEAADGEVEDYAVKVVAIAPDSAVLIDDPANPGKKVLVVSGTGKNDSIQFQLNGGALLCRRGCKLATYSLGSIGRIVLLGGGGSDTVSMPSSLAIPMQLIGQWKVNKTK